LPKKNKAKPLRNRYLNYLIVIKDDKIAVEKRSENDIWTGLYQFPLEETATQLSKLNNAELMAPPLKHILSHQRLFISFWDLNLAKHALKGNYQWVTFNELIRLPFPIAIKRFIDANLLHLRHRPQ